MSAGDAGTESGTAASSAGEEALLHALVAERWPGASIRQLDRLPGDASTRRYARAHLRGAGAPTTVIAMLLPPGEEALRSEELSAPPPSGSAADLPFVAVGRFLAGIGVPVPELHLDATGRGVLLLEDVGDTALATRALELLGAGARPALEGLFTEAIEVLGRLAVDGIANPDPHCIAFRSTYDRHLIERELEVVASHGLAPSNAGAPLDPRADRELWDVLSRLGDALDSQPRVLMHRDFHAWNLHVDPAGRVRVIDFQDALPGPALYDLASLCTDRDSDRFVDPALEAKLVAQHATTLQRVWPGGGSLEAISAAYRSAVAYRTLRVIGRFRFLAMEKDKPGYLHFLPRMARQTMRALAAADGDASVLARVLVTRSALFAEAARPS